MNHAIPGQHHLTKALAGAILLFTAVPSAIGGEPADDGAPITVVLVTIDTLRADAVSFMGCARPMSPFLDSLAESAVVFERAYSTSSWTVPAIASIFTSRYPSSHGLIRGEIIGGKNKEVWHQTALSPELATLAGLFRRAGYRTVGVAANRHLQTGSGFELGFDHYYGYAGFLSAEKLNEQLRETMADAFGPDWRKTWKNEKVFLWIHYFDPHHPYFPKEPWIKTFDPEYRDRPGAFPWRLKAPELNAAYSPSDAAMTRRLLALYHSEVRYTDQQLRAVFADLDIDDRALVVLVADHGEEFGEHGNIGHRRTLYEEVVRVPMFISWPSQITRGARLDEIVSVVDILPTMVGLASLAPPEGIQGRSLVPLINGHPGSGGSTAFLEFHRSDNVLRAMVGERWKLMIGSRNLLALYDLESDPGEKTNVAADHAELTQDLTKGLEAWSQTLLPPPPTTDFSSRDREEIEKLRALGYVDK